MSPELEEFRQRLIVHARQVASRASRVDNEAKTNNYLVQPFLTALGYDVSNPDEVSPEHRADFSEKYQNRADYAILHLGQPVIALESKRCGTEMKNDRGQLRSYFNACPTIKLGILTDGLRFEFYADSDSPNMMDEKPFLTLNMGQVAASGVIEDHILEGVAAIRSGHFNPENVGAEAKRKLLFEAIVATIRQFKSSPSDEFVRFVLNNLPEGNKAGRNVTQKLLDVNRDVIKSAMEAFVAEEALARFGYAPKDVVKAPSNDIALSAVAASSAPATEVAENEVVAPTDREMKMFRYMRDRLFYLVKEDQMFDEVDKITFRKNKTSFRVYYGRPNNGSLFDYREHKDGKVLLQFPSLANLEVAATKGPDLDAALLKSFAQRVRELSAGADVAPNLRAIKGGKP